MDIKILDKTENKITFLLEDSNPQFANSIRRIAMMEVPVLAINFVDFSKNDSVLYNEVIAHRLGLVPLVFKAGDFNLPDKCKCDGKGCALCQTQFALSKKGPCTVYSGDMKSTNKEVKVLYDNIPIVILDDKQELKFEATAIMGLGKDHARWQSGIAWYRYYPSAKLTGALKNSDQIVKSCPKNALKIDGSKVSVSTECDLCRECENVADPKGALKISGDETKLIFTVETVCGLGAEEIVMQAVDVLKAKAAEFEKEVGKL